MNKVELKSILDSFSGDENDLYNKINFLDMPSNKFNKDDYEELVFRNMYMYHKMYGIENLSLKWLLPIIVEKDISYDEFREYLRSLKQHDVIVQALPKIKNHYQNIVRLSASKLLDMGDMSWTRIYSSKMTGKAVAETGKMYISVDNKDLYGFANSLLEKCIEQGLNDYEFKVNRDESQTRRDNLVIYFTDENAHQYISLIDQIIKENPNIQFNAQSIVGYSIDSNIAIGKDYEKGQASFTKTICNEIISLRQEGRNDSEIIELVDDVVQIHLGDLLDLKQSRMNEQSQSVQKDTKTITPLDINSVSEQVLKESPGILGRIISKVKSILGIEEERKDNERS